MREINPDRLRVLALDVEAELERLQQLADDIAKVQQEIERDPERAVWFYELQSLKLHNFYTGCERIFSLVASELNGGLPSSFDWHKRLLRQMTVDYGNRIPVLRQETARQLQEYLGFRHVVRNIYGFELESARVRRLLDQYPGVWNQCKTDLYQFVTWLQELAKSMEDYPSSDLTEDN